MGRLRAAAIAFGAMIGAGACGRINFEDRISGETRGLVATGSRHACAVRRGEVWCWGQGETGQLGNGATDHQLLPVRAGQLSDVTQVAAGDSHTCALTASGAVYCWGYVGVGGNLRVVPAVITADPLLVAGLPPASSIAAGWNHACALTEDGDVWCWGYNDHGQVGDGTTSMTGISPVRVGGLGPAADIVAGANTSCARLSGGEIRCWGENWFGHLLDGTMMDRPTPIAIPGLTADGIAIGFAHLCALVAGGRYQCWGRNGLGELGDGSTQDRRSLGTPSLGADHVAIDAGDIHTCALRAGGDVVCWGANTHGALGDGTAVPRSAPVAVVGAADIVEVSAGENTTCALRADGDVLCWGYGSFGEIGDGRGASAIPLAVPGISAAKVDAGEGHTCAITGGGAVHCWGANTAGQLGDGSTEARAAPAPVAAAWGTVGALELALGMGHSCALLVDGSVWCWGDNADGQLGDGTAMERTTPVAVAGLGTAISIAAGDRFSCAVKSDGTAWCWGQNNAGQLGDGMPAARSLVPVQVLSVTGADQITAGGYFACAHHAGTTVSCWGYNTDGQLGIGTTASSPPTALSISATTVRAGWAHACALDAAGTVSCWGRNGAGEHGDGTTTNKTSPALTGITGVTALELGATSTCGIVGGTASCWGHNAYGQLGDGTFISRTTAAPTALAGAPISIATGARHACAVSGSTVSCWGDNELGQLGNGIASRSLTATRVALP